MAIPQEYIAQLAQRTDIAELVGAYVQLKRAGRMEKGLCPFHNEKTPSFYIYPDTSSFYCFGCGAGGDAISFVMRTQNLEYIEAVKFLAARVGMPLPDEDDGAARARQRMLSINRESAKYYALQLNQDAARPARAYLRARGLADTSIRSFGLGFSPDESGALRGHLKQLGFSEDEMLQAAVCKKSERGGVYDAFRGRLIFPIIDLRGNVIAFGGRSLGQGKGPKYLNSADSPVFKKSQNLYALNIARKNTARRIVLAEGYMDVISLHQAGFTCAVATLGTALTPQQAKLIAGCCDEVVICYDTDEAGQRATARAIEVLSYTQLKVRVLALSGAKDPDEFIQKFGPQRFEQLLNGSANTIEYALAKVKATNSLTSEDGRAAYIRAALVVLASVQSPVEREIYAGRIAEEANVAKQAVLLQLDGFLRQHYRQLARDKEKRQKNETSAASISLPYTAGGAKALGPAFAEQQLVAAIFKDPAQFLPLAAQQLEPQQFLLAEMAEVYTLLLQNAENLHYIDISMLSAQLSQENLAKLSRLLAQNYDISFSPQDVDMFIQRILAASAAGNSAAEMGEDELRRHLENIKKRKA